MPRNGDGSGDNGPIDGHAIIHGTSGDVCDVVLEKAKHVLTLSRKHFSTPSMLRQCLRLKRAMVDNTIPLDTRTLLTLHT
jgi:hypothetical protein